MAETVATILYEVGAAWATDAAIYIASNAAYINAAAAFVASSAYGGYQKRKAAAAARDAFNSGLEDRLVMTASAQGARSRVYGRVRNVDGVVFKATHGSNSEFYTLVIALAGHEVDAIEQIYFDDVPITLDGSGYVQTAPWYIGSLDSHRTTVGSGTSVVNLGSVPAVGATMVWESNEAMGISAGQQSSISTSGTTVTFAAGAPATGATILWQTNNGTSKARVRAYTGAPGQNLYPVLQPLVGSVVQATDRFEGIACLVATFEYNTDAFPGGLPQVSAVMRGAKVYDWRAGTTAWSENPALIAYDWARYAHGGDCAAGEIKQASFTTAANACDVSTTFTTTSGTETRPLYQCGIAIPLDGNPDEALAEIVESMAGQWGWAGGQLTLRAGAYRAPVATITEDWITDASATNVVDTGTADLVNIMRPTLPDAAGAYVPAAAADVPAAAYITADGRELTRELTLGGVTRAVHAQHVCGVLMRETREGLTITLPCNFRAYPLELFDVVTLVLPTFGWGAGKLFEVTGWEFGLTGAIQLTLRETAAAIYTPDSTFDVINTSANTALPNPSVVPQVVNVAVTSSLSTLSDGVSIVTRTLVTFDAVAAESVRQSGSIEVQYVEAYGPLPGSDWPAAPPVPGSATSATIVGLKAGTYYMVRARAISSLGVRGRWSAQVLHRVSSPPSVIWSAIVGTGKPADNAGAVVNLVNAGNMTVTGNTISKTSGGTGYNASVYSRDGYTGGAYVTWSPAQASKYFMVGLNSDPATDASYSSIDFGIEVGPTGNMTAYESTVGYSLGAYVAGDVLAITYDGARVRYLRNGVVLRTVAIAITTPLYLDTAFFDLGAKATNLAFGPLSAVTGIGTGQIDVEAATKVQQYFNSGPVSVTTSTHFALLTATNPDTTSRQIVVHGSFDYAGVAGGSGVSATLIATDGSTPVEIGRLTGIAAGASVGDKVIFSLTYLLAGGATGTYTMQLSNSAGSWASMAFTNIALRTELILR